MLNLSINRSSVALILSICLILLTACRDDETDPKSFLNSYRILALQLNLLSSHFLVKGDFPCMTFILKTSTENDQR